MSFRNMSPCDMFEKLSLEHEPKYSFKGETKEDFDSWKSEALPKVLATLGDFPRSVPVNPQFVLEWEHDGVTKQRWLIDVQEHLSAGLQINIPKDMQEGEKRPAILCWHGHGKFGKESVMGNDSTTERRAVIQSANYNYGHQMAQNGYVTFAIDWIGRGERNDNEKPHFRSHNWSRDWCNLYYLNATMLGMTSLSINLAHGKAATDFVSSLPFVDENKLGVMGLSGGGTMTLWTALYDERFSAAEIICYSNLFAYFGFRDLNYCGMQITPGLYKLVDLPELQGLIAPRPLLVDIGVHDTCFPIDSSLACHKKVEQIYKAAGVPEMLELDLFPGEHSWGGNKSVDFFARHLR